MRENGNTGEDPSCEIAIRIADEDTRWIAVMSIERERNSKQW